MVRHVIIWKLKDGYTGEEISRIKKDIKEGLEGLAGNIPGLKEIRVYTDPLESSNCDLILDSLFENEESLMGYIDHPLHVDVAQNKVRPFVAQRNCIDFKVKE